MSSSPVGIVVAFAAGILVGVTVLSTIQSPTTKQMSSSTDDSLKIALRDAIKEGMKAANGGGAPPQVVVNCPPSAGSPPVASLAVVPFATSHATTSVVEDVADFVKLALRCTDKTTTHNYQHMYGTVMHPYRGPHPAGQPKPFKLLEMGLGCDMPCVAGGFKLFNSYLPRVEYHTFEFDYDRCKKRFGESDINAEEAAYLDAHVCRGSSADEAALKACGEKFGPFDIIIDDASHRNEHIQAAFTYWFPSSYLKPGGLYVAEDLQTQVWGQYGATREKQEAGDTFARWIIDLISWKLCAAPQSLVPECNPHYYGGHFTIARHDKEYGVLRSIFCDAEACAFTKKSA